MSLATIIVWVIIGVLAGSAASSVMGRGGRANPIMNTLLGLIGAVIGGALFDVFNVNIWILRSITINMQQLLAAFVGAVILIVLVRGLSRR